MFSFIMWYVVMFAAMTYAGYKVPQLQVKNNYIKYIGPAVGAVCWPLVLTVGAVVGGGVLYKNKTGKSLPYVKEIKKLTVGKN